MTHPLSGQTVLSCMRALAVAGLIGAMMSHGCGDSSGASTSSGAATSSGDSTSSAGSTGNGGAGGAIGVGGAIDDAADAADAKPPLPKYVSLTTAASFVVLAGQTVTNTGFTVINGDVGISPGSAITGFPPGIVNGTIHSADARRPSKTSTTPTSTPPR